MPLTTALLLSGLLVPGFTGCEDELDPSRVPELIRLLGSEEAKVRAEAAQQLGQIGPEARSAIPDLIVLLGDPALSEGVTLFPRNVYSRAATALQQIGVEAVPALVDALKSDDRDVVLMAARALGEIGPRAKTALPSLVQRLDADDQDLRSTVLRSISRIDSSGEKAIPVLIERLRDKSVYIRADAARLLAQRGRGAEAAGPELLKALKDPKPRVRGAAARALAEIGAKENEALPRLLELLSDKGDYQDAISNHAFGYYRVADDAAYALGIFGRAESIPFLIEAAQDPESLPDVAIDALAGFGPRAKDAVPVLLQALSEGQPGAASALVKIGVPKEALPRLKELLGSENVHVRLDAALVLCSLEPANTRDEREIILAALDSDDLRHHAAETLGDLGPSADFAVPRLVANLEENEISLWEIATTLGKIGPAAKPAGPILIRHLRSWVYNAPVTEALVGIGPAMVPLLVDELESKPDSADMCIGLLQALAAFGPQADAAVPALVAALDDRCRSVRVAAAAALRHVRTRPELAVPALTRASSDPRPTVRSEAARSLGEYGPDAARAVDTLAAALSDDYLDVRVSAAEALGTLGATARPALPALRQAAKSGDEMLRDAAHLAIGRIE